MAKKKRKIPLRRAHRHFAETANNEVWDLLGRKELSPEEGAAMLDAAHASAYHWQRVGTAVHLQRSAWLLSRVYAVLGQPVSALRYAGICLYLTESHPEEMKDFDVAYAYESLGWAYALAGNRRQSQRYRNLAEKACRQIADEEDRAIFTSDASRYPRLLSDA